MTNVFIRRNYKIMEKLVDKLSVCTVLEVNFIILKTMFNPFSFIFVILELKFFLSVAQWGHEAKHKLLKKNVAH